jgi:hypothetical protein
MEGSEPIKTSKKKVIIISTVFSVLTITIIVVLSLYFTGNLTTSPAAGNPSPIPPEFFYPDVPKDGINVQISAFNLTFTPKTRDGSAFPAGVWTVTPENIPNIAMHIHAVIDQNTGNLTITKPESEWLFAGTDFFTVKFTNNGIDFTMQQIKLYHNVGE